MAHKAHSTGAASEQLVSAYLTTDGKDVFVPLKTQSRCDLVYLDGARAVRVQVKTGTRTRTGRFTYEQCRLIRDTRGYAKSEAYTAADVDEVWVVGTHLWCFPISMIEGRSSLCLLSDNAQPKPNAKDYDPDSFIVVRRSFEAPFRDSLSA